MYKEIKKCKYVIGHMTTMAAMPIYCKTLKAFFRRNHWADFEETCYEATGTHAHYSWNFPLSHNCHFKAMRFIRSYDNPSLLFYHDMTCMHISKQYSENHGLRTIHITSRKFRPKLVDFTEFSRFHLLSGDIESIL